MARLRERIRQAEAEIAGLEAQAMSLTEQSALIAQELESQRALFKEGLTVLSRVLALERAAKELEGQSGTNAAQIARVRGRIAELEIQILQIDSDRIAEAEEQARDVSAQENQVKERLASVRERLGRMEVAGPGRRGGVRDDRFRARRGGAALASRSCRSCRRMRASLCRRG